MQVTGGAGGATRRRSRIAWALVCVMSGVVVTARAYAQPDAVPVHARISLGAAAMISEDQVGRLGYDSFGFVGEAQLGYSLWPWLAARLSLCGGGFPADAHTGGLLAPLLGVALTWPNDGMRPFFELGGGVAFTGSIQRPMLRSAIGLDIPISAHLTLGPVIGYSHVFQHSAPGASTDAGILWFGVVLGWTANHSWTSEHERWVTRQRTVQRVEIVRRPAPPPSAATEPTPELSSLLDEALPTQRNEWLAPILFKLDSAELEPQGVAMLHEVVTGLGRLPQLKLLEVRGYADSRGNVEHNLALSERRAHAVVDWLVAHGVAPERLRVAAQGASDFVEPGANEAEHEQNRRVVFRVVESGER